MTHLAEVLRAANTVCNAFTVQFVFIMPLALLIDGFTDDS